MRENVVFYSEGSKVSGHLYKPDNMEEGKKYPAIVLCHGFAGIKEALVPPFAEGFAKNGYIALAFDYRGFGESEGERGDLVPAKQVFDIRNAITYILSVPGADAGRLGLWGTSFGGANAITVTALDKRVKAVVVQLTFGDGERVVAGSLKPEEKEKLIQTLNKVWARSVTQNKNMMMGLTQILTDADSKVFFEKVIVEHPSINIKIPFTFVRHSMEYKPEQSLKDVKIPVMIVGAEKDIVNPPGESKLLFEKANEPKALYMVKGATHFEVYEGEKFREAFQQELSWYNKYL